MNYQAALQYILSFTDYERSPGVVYSPANFDLRRMDELLERLGAPHLGARSVHIAGSKGKGSTAAMIAAGLRAAGYRTGLFTSPHLHTLRERIAVDGEPIAEEELASLVERLRPDIDAVHRDSAYGKLTTFEILTALAFAYFRQRGVDFQVLEAGLGGRLDATNVVNPEVCVITSISLDHTSVLGDSIEKIAAEKAGIVKPQSVVISSPQPPQAAMAISEACHKMGARLVMVGRELTWRRTAADLTGQSFRVIGERGSHELAIPLLGDHQLENAVTAVAALEALGIGGQAIASGLRKVRWPGRLEILQYQPTLVVDGAHNADSARRLREAMRQYFDFDHLILIIGTSSDKNIVGIVEELVPLTDRVIVTRSRHPRSAEPFVLVGEFARYCIRAEVARDVATAVSEALTMAKAGGLILATGSLFVVAEVIEYQKGLPAELYPKAQIKERVR